MRKTMQRNRMRIVVVGVLLGVVSAGVIAIVQAGGLATQPVGKISGELVITGEDGVRQAVVTATQTYLQSTKQGMVHVAIKKESVRIAVANARIKADTQEQAASAVTALILLLTGRPARPGFQCQDVNEGSGRGLQCSEVRFEGDSRMFAEQADKIIDWWDALTRLTYSNYVSPMPDFTSLGKLQLNTWNTLENIGSGRMGHASYAILYFDPADPTKVVGGTILMSNRGPEFEGNIVSGSLQDRTDTPAPGDFDLEFVAQSTNQVTFQFFAQLAIDVLPNGLIDVRGVTHGWPASGSPVLLNVGSALQGTGNTKFVVPGQ